MHPHAGLWGVLRGRCCAYLAPPLRSPAPLPPSADYAQSDENSGYRLHRQFVKNGHPGVANSPSSIAVAGRVSTLPGPSGQPRSGTNWEGDPKADRSALEIGALMWRSISPTQENAGCQTASVCAPECTWQLAVSYVGREHRRAQGGSVSSTWGRPTRAAHERLDASDDVIVPSKLEKTLHPVNRGRMTMTFSFAEKKPNDPGGAGESPWAGRFPPRRIFPVTSFSLHRASTDRLL
jgi:hypothetical protein